MICFYFLIAVVLANLSVFWFGPMITPIVAFALIGPNLSLRDKLHERWHGQGLGIKMLGLIAMGSLATYLTNNGTGRICVASILAFAGSLTTDALIYERVFVRPRFQKMNISNFGSAAIDSLIFPTIAFGTLMPKIIVFQFVAKIVGGALWAWMLTRRAR